MDEFIKITSALADPGRVRILLALDAHEELCVCQIVELLGLATSTVSKHLSILKQAGLADSRKDARWMFYRIAEDLSAAAQSAMEFVKAGAGNAEPARSDKKRLKFIMKQDPEELCRLQAGRSVD